MTGLLKEAAAPSQSLLLKLTPPPVRPLLLSFVSVSGFLLGFYRRFAKTLPQFGERCFLSLLDASLKAQMHPGLILKTKKRSHMKQHLNSR